MKTISLTVPMDYNALTRASDMLNGLALDLKQQDNVGVQEPEPEKMPDIDDTKAPGPKTETSEADQVIAPPPPSEKEEKDPSSVFGGAETTAETAAPTEVDLAPSTTNQDILIPWDSRIHSGSKAKLAKKPNGWKMKRNVSDALVTEVEAELIAVMQASPANPIEPKPITQVNESNAVDATETAPITTFAGLMSAITSNGIGQDAVISAVNKVGINSLPLLAARPDLIPHVAKELGFGG